MDKQAIHAKIAEVISDLFDIDRSRITLEATFQDLELTSIDAIDLAVELQRHTGKKLTEAGLRKVRTIGDVVELVYANVSSADQAS
jgi:acyl carrier protein